MLISSFKLELSQELFCLDQLPLTVSYIKFWCYVNVVESIIINYMKHKLLLPLQILSDRLK
jgi:hypothetical protein